MTAPAGRAIKTTFIVVLNLGPALAGPFFRPPLGGAGAGAREATSRAAPLDDPSRARGEATKVPDRVNQGRYC